jgi:chromate transporter
MIAFVENQVVTQLGWLTPQEFLDGLALGQLTPGPILMLAAFIGFKLHGVPGAIVGGGAIFLPSFVMMLIVLPLLRRMQNLQWLKAFMRGVAPAVIGALAVALAQMAPHAAPDWFTWVLMLGTVVLMLKRNVGPLPVMLAGGFIGVIARRATAAAAIAAIGAWLSMQAPAQAQRAGATVDTIVWPGSEPVVYVEPHPGSPVATTPGNAAR